MSVIGKRKDSEGLGKRKDDVALQSRRSFSKWLAVAGTTVILGCGGRTAPEVIMPPEGDAGQTSDAKAYDAHAPNDSASADRHVDAKGIDAKSLDARYDSKPASDSGTKPDAHKVDAGFADAKNSSDGPAADSGMLDAALAQKCSTVTPLPYVKWAGYLFAGGDEQIVGGYSFSYLGKDQAGNAKFHISCNGAAISDPAYPFGSDTPYADAANGKRILVKPVAGNAMLVNVSITVQDL